MWFLGAGVSRSAGMPTATDIIWDLKRRYYCLKENQDFQSHGTNNQAIKRKIQEYMDSKGFPAEGSPEEYSFYFDLTFGKDYDRQQTYISDQLDSEKDIAEHWPQGDGSLLGDGARPSPFFNEL